MAKLQLRDYAQILQRLIARTVSRSGLSDLTNSSGVRHLLGGVAREVDDAYYQLTRLSSVFSIDTATGQDLDERAQDISPSILFRTSGLRSTGLMVFSRPTNTGVTLTIPRGTIVSTSDGIQVRTLAEAVITNSSVEQISGHGVGRDSNSVSATSVAVGSASNIAAGTATILSSRPSGVSEATNTSAFTGGRDRETDDEFRERIRLFINGLARSTVQALRYGVYGVANPAAGATNTVVFSHVFEDPIDRGNVIVYIDDGSGTARTVESITGENVCEGLAGSVADTAVGNEEYLNLDYWPVDATFVTLESRTGDPAGVNSSLRGTLTANTHYYLNPANGQVYFVPALVAGEYIVASYDHFTGLIEEVQKVIDGDPANRTTYPGYRAAGVRVLVATPSIVSIEVEGTITFEEGATRTTVLADAESSVLNYINTRGISGDIVRNEIIERIMATTGVLDVDLVLPAANIAVQDDELPRSTSGDVRLT